MGKEAAVRIGELHAFGRRAEHALHHQHHAGLAEALRHEHRVEHGQHVLGVLQIPPGLVRVGRHLTRAATKIYTEVCT